MSAPDISAEAVERLAEDFDTMRCYHNGKGPEAAWYENAAATLRALRAALDAAERERDAYMSSEAEVLAESDALRFTLNNARLSDATGYARGEADGIRKAAEAVKGSMAVKLQLVDPHVQKFHGDDRYRDVRAAYAAAILALLPATDATKETRDAE